MLKPRPSDPSALSPPPSDQEASPNERPLSGLFSSSSGIFASEAPNTWRHADPSSNEKPPSGIFATEAPMAWRHADPSSNERPPSGIFASEAPMAWRHADPALAPRSCASPAQRRVRAFGSFTPAAPLGGGGPPEEAVGLKENTWYEAPASEANAFTNQIF
jgi:hypothetical protein